MQWHVVAADAQTGEDRSFLVEAATAGGAEERARRAGFLVSQVSPAALPAPPPPAGVDEVFDPLSRLADAAAARGSLNYEPPRAARHEASGATPPPDYWGLRFGSTAFLVFAGLFYLAGALLVLGGLFTVATAGGAGGGGIGFLAAGAQFFASLWPLAVGALFHALSAACVALRDIARNSFAASRPV